MHEADMRARFAGARLRDNREPPRQDPLGAADCWCGQRGGHDWPGKADGEPHPTGSRP